MKFIKVINEKEVIIEDDNQNNIVLYERNGFKEVKEKEKKLDK